MGLRDHSTDQMQKKDISMRYLQRQNCVSFTINGCALSKAGILPRSLCSGTVCSEAYMPGPVVCVQCDKAEEECTCEKYCTICQGQLSVRLGEVGFDFWPDRRGG